MSILHIDFETFSACDLKTEGLDNYARHSSTGVHCMAFAFDDGPVGIMSPAAFGQFHEFGLWDHVASGGLVYAHNAAFELAIWNLVMVPRYGWPELKPEQCRCTMAMAYAMGLPGSLEAAAPALGIAERKDNLGKRIMSQVCRPKEDGTFWKLADDPEKFQRLYAYCQTDVEVERALHHRLMELSAQEQAIWQLDYRINQNGILVDLPSIDKAIALVEQEKARLNDRMLRVTSGSVGSCTEVQLLTKWIRSQGVKVPGLAKADVFDALDGDLPPLVREALELRKEAAKSSTAKLAAMKQRAAKDGRVRGIHQYHGAGTGRWAGRGVQTQNYPRPRRHAKDDAQQERCIAEINAAISAGDFRALDVFYGPLMDALADGLRGMIVAPPGKDLLGVDFSAVEALVLAWLAGQDDVLDAFRNREDIYKLAASRIYRVPKEQVDKQQRQIGKVAVLACLGATTPVLTNNGYKAIVEVSTKDLLWDGAEWVAHQGVVQNGVQQVVIVDGIEVTPDHLIKTNQTWRPAKQLASRRSILSQALETGLASLQSLRSSECSPECVRYGWFGFNVRAARTRIWFTNIICAKVRRLGATAARKSKLPIGERTSGLTPTLFQTTNTVDAYSTESPHAITDATTQTTSVTRTTARGASTFTSLGERTDANFSLTSSLWTVGISRAWNWIVSTLTAATSREIFGSSVERRTSGTGGVLSGFNAECRNWKPVFDILNSGPRNCFLVKSASGHLLVHNCGYQGGVGAFQAMAKAYNVKMSDEAADQIKAAWRQQHPAIVGYWYAVEDAAIAAVRTGMVCAAGPKGREVAFRKKGSFLWCKLPSGRVLCYPYPELRTVTTPWGEEKEALTYMTVVSNVKAKVLDDPASGGKWKRISTYGGSLAENITQAVARDLLAEAMLRLDGAGAKIVMHVHDEVVLEVDATAGEDTLKRVEAIMAETPTWANGLPLAAEGWRGPRYRK